MEEEQADRAEALALLLGMLVLSLLGAVLTASVQIWHETTDPASPHCEWGADWGEVCV